MNDMKIADVLDRIIKTLNRINSHTIEFCGSNRIYILFHMEIFSPIDKFQFLDFVTKKWWKPSPNIGVISMTVDKSPKHFAYWFETWMPDY